MKRRPQNPDNAAVNMRRSFSAQGGDVGIVLSGGGSRAAYQIGALKALAPHLLRHENPVSIIIGSSIGAINGLMIAATFGEGLNKALAITEEVWRERVFQNTFEGSPSTAFFRAVRMAVVQYLAPGPNPSQASIFNPRPLMRRVDGVIDQFGGLSPDALKGTLHTVAVMTTVEGAQRKPLLFVSSKKDPHTDLLKGASFEVNFVKRLHAKHGFASAALPSVLPPVELDTENGTVRLVDGGISMNVPVDPAARLGAEQVVVVDISGRSWWHDRYQEPHDTSPTWEVKSGSDTFCLRPPETLVFRNQDGLGKLLKASVGNSTKKFMSALGPVWPVFQLLKRKLGEELAYEVVSYVALDHDYVQALLEAGFNETHQQLQNRGFHFTR